MPSTSSFSGYPKKENPANNCIIVEAFAKLINHPSGAEADITILDITEWDREGQYKDVVDATREASKGADVRVYRVSIGGPRVEYWVVGLDKGQGRLVGVKALGIES